MNKLTKVLSVFVIAGAIGTGILGATGCKHHHTYSDEWTSAGAEGHYHLATCKHTDEHTDIEEHVYDDDKDTTCNDCGYVRTIQSSDSDVEVTEVSISGADTVEVDKSIQLTANITPSNATNKSVSWDIIEGADLAEISAGGLLTAYSETGTVKVKATVGGKNATKTITITEAQVDPNPPTPETPTVSSVTINGDDTVKVNATLTLSATVAGSTGIAQTVTWSVENGTGAATISDSGVLTPSQAGTVTVKATSTVDTTKFATKEITIAELTKYDVLCGQTNKIYNNDFSGYQTDEKLPLFKGSYDVKGVYSSQNGKTNATDNTNYVKVNADGAAELVDPASGDGNGASTVMHFAIGPTSGMLEGYVEVTFIGCGTSWTPLQFVALDGSEVFRIRVVDENALQYSAQGSVDSYTYSQAETAIKPGDNTYKVYFKVSAENKLTLTINGSSFVTDLQLLNGLGGVKFVSSDSKNKRMSIDNLVVCGNELTASEFAAVMKDSLDAEYASYNLPVDYTHNGALVTSAYNAGIAAIEAATDIKGISEAYKAAVDKMSSVLSDSQISAAQEEACANIVAAYPAANYTKEGLTDNEEGERDEENNLLYPDSQYNNKEKFEEALAAAQEEIRTKTNRADIQAAYDKHDALLGAILTDSEVILAKIAEAQHRIEVYLADEIEALKGGEFNATYLELVRLKSEEGTELLPQWRTVTEINEKLAALKERVDDIYATTTMTPDEAKAANVAALREYVTEQLADFDANIADDQEVIVAIQGADGNGGVLAAGIAAINAVETRGEANAELIKARTTVAFIVTRGKAVQAIKSYSENLKKDFYLATARALFDTEAATHIANAKAVEVPTTVGDTWEEGFETANQAITNVRIAAREALDGTVDDATALELAARDTWSGTATVPINDKADFKVQSATITEGMQFGSKIKWLTLSTKGTTKWVAGSGLSTKSGVFKFTTKSVGAKIIFNYYSVSSGRTFTLKGPDGNVGTGTGGTAGVYEAYSWGKGTDYSITLGAVGEYTITFSSTEHKLAYMVLEDKETNTITGAKVNSLTATGTNASDVVVKAEIEYEEGEEGNKKTVKTTVTLNAGEYTVVGDTVIYGAGKTADDANKYNSCKITAAQE